LRHGRWPDGTTALYYKRISSSWCPLIQTNWPELHTKEINPTPTSSVGLTWGRENNPSSELHTSSTCLHI
jgi:hypothetical protein